MHFEIIYREWTIQVLVVVQKCMQSNTVEPILVKKQLFPVAKQIYAISDNTKTLYTLDKSWVILGSTVCACMHISEKEILIAGSLGRREK